MEYIYNVVRFIDAILSNNATDDHCKVLVSFSISVFVENLLFKVCKQANGTYLKDSLKTCPTCDPVIPAGVRETGWIGPPSQDPLPPQCGD